MSKTTLKSLPTLATDEAAEAFVENADLSEYDLSGFVPLHLVLDRPSDEGYVRVPHDLEGSLRAKAEALGVPFAQFVRNLLEDSLKQ